MPKQPPAPKRAPAIPMGGTIPGLFSGAPVKTAVRTTTRPTVDDTSPVFFYALMALIALGLAAMGYALLTM